MSPISGVSGSSLPSIVEDLLIAENIGEIVDTSGLGAQDTSGQAPAGALLADAAPGNLAPGTLALSLVGLKPPQVGLAGLDTAALLGQAPSDSQVSDAAGSKPHLATAAEQPALAEGTLNALQHLSGNPALQGDGGGIIPSFILNAAMIPGLQLPPIPPGVPTAVAPAVAMPEDEALTYLANLGANEALLEKLRKILKRKVPGKRLLVGLAALMTALGVVTEALARELKAAEEDRQANEEARSYAESRGHRGRRHRLYLE